MNQTEKKVKKAVFKHLDKIYKGSVEATKPYMKGMVSIAVLKEIIKRAKIKDELGVIPKQFIVKFNDTLKIIENLCVANASKSGFIPSVLLKTYIDVVKTSFVEGLINK